MTTKEIFRNRILAASGCAVLAAALAAFAVGAHEFWFLVPAGLSALASFLAFWLAFESHRYDPK